MSGTRAARAVVAGLLCVVAACFYTTAPDGWLPTASEAKLDAYGGYIDVTLNSGTRVQGELLAVTDDSIHVLWDPAPGPPSERWIAIAFENVRHLDVTGYDIQRGDITAIWALGTLSTASHGFFLLLSVPVWAVAGSIAASEASNAPHLTLADGRGLRTYARFPAGVPAGVDRTRIRGRNDNTQP